MKFKHITRQPTPLVTLGELVIDQHPELFKALVIYTEPRDLTDWLTAAAWLTPEEKRLARLMEEPPRPGRGGQ